MTTKLPASVGEYAALPQSDYINALSLGIATAESISSSTWPANAKYVAFSSTGDFYMKFNGTAAAATDTTDGTASELNPTMRRMLLGDATAVTSISLISPAACIVTMSFYQQPGP